LADPAAGELRIGTSIVLASGFVAVVLDQLSRRYPRIVFHLVAAESGITYRTLEERKVDLVVLHMFALEEHLRADVLYDERMFVVAGAQNPWTRRRKVELADLINQPWTLPALDSIVGAIVVEAF